ncbi:hypothetical protein [Paludisphaera soli]|uniref:hypothetical protein n=1 Tax=Paludisphaera soli TaxID=2712865 RepID=UPI0013EA9F50|nr:hypothetical protein [Paludisphaera soli]
MNTATAVPVERKRGEGEGRGRWERARLATRALGRAAMLAAAAAAFGCSDDAASGPGVPVFPVKGKVTFEGEPAAGAFVVFNPKTPPKAGAEAYTPRATVQADGSFSLTSATEGDGAPAGDYAVTVQWTKPVKQGNDLVAGPNVIPKAYTTPATTPLQVTVKDSDNALEPFAITRK